MSSWHPLTRRRADNGHVPLPFVKKHYVQRAIVPGTMLVTEAAYLSPRGSGSPEIPGIWSQEQIGAWREVTAAVHARGSQIYFHLWCLGCIVKAKVLQEEFELDIIGAGDIHISKERSTPGPICEEEGGR
jgi:NADPH2 dehydrogenase